MYYKIEHYKKKVNQRKIINDILFVYILAVTFVFLINTLFIQNFKIESSSMEPQLQENQKILVNKFIVGPKYPFTDYRIFNSIDNINRGDIVVFYSDDYMKTNRFFRFLSSFIYTLTFSLVELPNYFNNSASKKYYDTPSYIYIKRVIGIPGDIIEYKVIDGKGVVFINGKTESEILPSYDIIEENENNSPLLSKMINKKPYVVKDNEFYVLGDNRVFSSDSRIWNKGITYKQIIGKAILIYYPFNRFGAIK